MPFNFKTKGIEAQLDYFYIITMYFLHYSPQKYFNNSTVTTYLISTDVNYENSKVNFIKRTPISFLNLRVMS